MNKAINRVIKSHILLTVLSVVAVILMVGGVSYALFQDEKVNTKNQKIEVGTLSANLTSISGRIVLNDLYPEDASNITDETKKFTFTITNDGTYDINYRVYMTDETASLLASTTEYSSYKQLNQDHYQYVNYKLDGTKLTSLGKTKTDDKFIVLEGSLKVGESEDHYLQFFLDNGDTTPTGAPNDVSGSIVSLDIYMEASQYEKCPEWRKYPTTTLANGLKVYDESITTYNECNNEMYTFTHPAAEQTEALTDYRYIGANPNNWIRFNDEDWRIIGVFTVETETGEKKQLIKIIRNGLIGSIPWDDYTDGSQTNEWSSASVQNLLNGDYYNTDGSFSYTYKTNSTSTGTTKTIPKGLNATARSQIENVKWYLGGSSTILGLGGPDYYAFERGTNNCASSSCTEDFCCTGKTRSTNIIQKVGLMYPSDYVYTYANGVDEKCYTDGYNCRTDQGGTPRAGWLYNSSYYQWTQAPDASTSYSAFYVDANGNVNNSHLRSLNDVRPAVYLTSDIKITGGDGSQGNAYTIE